MTFCYRTLVLLAVALVVSCGTSKEPASPLDTYKTYIKAAKAKDITAMKLLVTAESLKLYEQTAKDLGLTADDIAVRDSLFNENQTVIKTRNETIDGDTATIEVQNNFGRWEIIPFLREDGVWKIDTKGYADRLIQNIEMENDQLDREIEQNRVDPATDPVSMSTPVPTEPQAPADTNEVPTNPEAPID